MALVQYFCYDKKLEMLIEDINRTINFWIEQLELYSFNQLCTKPGAHSWSLGQLYIHLINDTNFYLEQIKICLTDNNNMNEEASVFAKRIFLNNNFPDERIEGAPSNALIPQPGSKQQLIRQLTKLKVSLNNVDMRFSKSECKGKTKHPGLNYFNANEWLQFAEIHFRHHLKQKNRIDDFLKHSSNT